MKMKVSEMEGAILDMWVARAEGKCHSQSPGVWGNALINELGRLSIAKNSWDCARYFEPSTNWAHGGPIIERASIALMHATDKLWAAEKWTGEPETREDKFVMAYGDTPLIAAMRCYVESKFGPEVTEE